MVEQGSGRAPTGQALAEVEPQERLAPSGFDPSRGALSCFACARWLPSACGDEVRTCNQPSGGTAFSTRGHYGSTVFDPMDGSALEINICDNCLVRVAKYKCVLHHRPGKKRAVFWKAPRDSDGRPQGGGAKQDAVHDSAGPQGHRPASGDTTNQREEAQSK